MVGSKIITATTKYWLPVQIWRPLSGETAAAESLAKILVWLVLLRLALAETKQALNARLETRAIHTQGL